MNKVAPSAQPPDNDSEQQLLMAAYVLGDLSKEEARSFEQLLHDNPELQVELTELQQSLEQLYGTEEVMPPAHLKGQILSAVTGSATGSTTDSATGSILDSIPGSIRRTPIRLSQWAMGGLSLAAAGLIAILGTQNYLLRQSLYALRSAPNQPPSESLTLDLAPVEGAESGQIKVVVNPTQLTAVVQAQNLPPLGADQVYALWTVVSADAPVTADDKGAILTAIFTVDDAGNQVKNIAVPFVFQDLDAAGDNASIDSDSFIEAVAVTVEDAAAPQQHQANPLWVQQL
jgi:Anti-sigma-K factor rskA